MLLLCGGAMDINLATKAALLSALLFPGWGQLLLKRYKRGVAIILLTVIGVLSIVFYVIQVAVTVLKTAPLKKEAVNFSAVVNLSVEAIKSLNLFYLLIILLFIILLWIFSIVDAYLLGKKDMSKITIVAHR
jgi:TM2 domain-containing membrane protein YozV